MLGWFNAVSWLSAVQQCSRATAGPCSSRQLMSPGLRLLPAFILLQCYAQWQLLLSRFLDA